MKKDDINRILRPWVTANLSPKDRERSNISSTYQKIKDILGDGCILMGSYARFTSTTPVKDIDILYRLPVGTQLPYSPSELLQQLQQILESSWQDKNSEPTFTQQSHSLKMEFLNKHFTVDIVPAITLNEENEFGAPLFLVPEIAYLNHFNRQKYYHEFLNSNTSMNWKRSDPLGYISETTKLNQNNPDFRKAIKIIKTWNTHCKKKLWNDKGFKSFHLECFLFNIFNQDMSLSLIESLFKFFREFKYHIDAPSVRDRADLIRYVDEYLHDFNEQERIEFRKQIDVALYYIEQMGMATDEENIKKCILNLCHPSKISCRDSSSENFLFDFDIQTFIDPKIFLNGYCLVHPQYGRKYPIDGKARHTLPKQATLQFFCDCPIGHESYWKVKNSLNSSEVRGEITKGSTKYSPEHTKYTGHHYVECYIVKNRICNMLRHFDVDIA